VGELHLIPDHDSFFHLPRDGGVSYAAQESWCLSETIQQNIIFGEPYDAERYKQVIKACGLETDLTLFDDGDQTEIGEKGVTLSGGQKARVTLARAVYSKTAIVLLDGKCDVPDSGSSSPQISSRLSTP
jgi:ABC-type bacteriocin/lantibiotic exporter with double-glycine peptidase domain